jgi:hypothetical protein
MRKKIFCGIAVLAIATLVAWNVSLNSQKSNKLSDTMLANVEALASIENTTPKTCGQKSEYVYRKEMCCTSPVKYTTTQGTNYSWAKTGSLQSYKSGFEGTVRNECATVPGTGYVQHTAETRNC